MLEEDVRRAPRARGRAVSASSWRTNGSVAGRLELPLGAAARAKATVRQPRCAGQRDAPSRELAGRRPSLAEGDHDVVGLGDQRRASRGQPARLAGQSPSAGSAACRRSPGARTRPATWRASSGPPANARTPPAGRPARSAPPSMAARQARGLRRKERLLSPVRKLSRTVDALRRQPSGSRLVWPLSHLDSTNPYRRWSAARAVLSERARLAAQENSAPEPAPPRNRATWRSHRSARPTRAAAALVVAIPRRRAGPASPAEMSRSPPFVACGKPSDQPGSALLEDRLRGAFCLTMPRSTVKARIPVTIAAIKRAPQPPWATFAESPLLGRGRLRRATHVLVWHAPATAPLIDPVTAAGR